jgi:sodium/hydrogen antiporter
MEHYNIILLVFGISLLGVAYLPTFLEKRPISYPIIYVALGIILFQLPLDLPSPIPLDNIETWTHLTELCVIISLMGTGLKVDQALSLRKWKIPLLLVSVTMVLSIALFSYTGYLLNELTVASAILLGSSLAPTDPVLASDIQVGGPREGKEDTVRFSLTTEAGLNDGMAFPFVNLAILWASFDSPPLEELSIWFLKDLLYKVVIGLLVGWIIGKALGYLIFKIPSKKNFHQPYEGFVALAITLITYGITESLKGYGFLAVFITAIVFRDTEKDHEYHTELHKFTEQLEKLFILILLILFGGAISQGLIADFDLNTILYALLSIFILRPTSGILSLIGTKTSFKERFIISFFGIKGIGSLFYLSFAMLHQTFADEKKLWTILSLTVLTSIVIHGIASPYGIAAIEKEVEKNNKSRKK